MLNFTKILNYLFSKKEIKPDLFFVYKKYGREDRGELACEPAKAFSGVVFGQAAADSGIQILSEFEMTHVF